mgnify:CR=1 FL=1
MRSVHYLLLLNKLLDPKTFWMLWKILIIKPDSKFVTAHKLFAFIIKLFIMSKIEVVKYIYKFLLFYEF